MKFLKVALQSFSRIFCEALFGDASLKAYLSEAVSENMSVNVDVNDSLCSSWMSYPSVKVVFLQHQY